MDAKLNLIRSAAAGSQVVLGCDDSAARSEIEVMVRAQNLRIFDAAESEEAFALRVPGEHMRLNARCAAGAVRALGVGDDVIHDGLREFAGLPHRLQWVANFGGVDYYNDSKATTFPAVRLAVASFDRPVVALVGGRRGEQHDAGAVASFGREIGEQARVVICFGGAAQELHDAAQRVNSAACRAATLREAVAVAAEMSRSGDVVLLAPGFQSYDEFANYEERGELYMSLVRAMS